MPDPGSGWPDLRRRSDRVRRPSRREAGRGRPRRCRPPRPARTGRWSSPPAPPTPTLRLGPHPPKHIGPLFISHWLAYLDDWPGTTCSLAWLVAGCNMLGGGKTVSRGDREVEKFLRLVSQLRPRIRPLHNILPLFIESKLSCVFMNWQSQKQKALALKLIVYLLNWKTWSNRFRVL